MMDNSPNSGNPARRFERLFFNVLNPNNNKPLTKFLRNYVDFLGAHQYWDFFAPDTPIIHRYLSVCDEIHESLEKPLIQCLKPLYQSYNGSLDDAGRSHHGERSRSFRLVENIFRLDQPELLAAFTEYWRNKMPGRASISTFLLLHEYTLYPGLAEKSLKTSRRDELIWVSPE